MHFDRSYIEETFQSMFDRPNETRSIVIHTGAGGADLFEEALENQLGVQRQYLGHKPPRFLKAVLRANGKKIRKSHTGNYFFTKPLKS